MNSILKFTIILVTAITIGSNAANAQGYMVKYSCTDDLSSSLEGRIVLSKGSFSDGACAFTYFSGVTNLVFKDGVDFNRNFTLEVGITPDKKFSKKLVRLLEIGVGEGLMKNDFSDAASFQSGVSSTNSDQSCTGGLLQELYEPIVIFGSVNGMKGGVSTNPTSDKNVRCTITIFNK